MAIEQEIEKLNIRGVILTSVLTAFGFVIALLWRDAVMKSIEYLKPQEESLLWIYFSALLVTIILTFAGYLLVKINQRFEKGR